MALLTRPSAAAFMSVLLVAGTAAGAELQVRPGQSIAAAISRAAPGDVVLVARGRYEENLLIDKPLTLRGVERPTLSGGLRGDTIRVTSADVTIENFIVTDSGGDLTAQNAGIYIQPGADRPTVQRCDIAYSLFGLWVEGVKDARIVDNLITGKRDYASAQRGNGIQLFNTTGAHIVGNRISFVRDGIYVDVSHHAIFRGNRIHDTRYGTHYMNSYYNVWEDNDVYRNRGGLALMETRNQIVRNNRAWNNSDHGIMLRTIQDSTIENNVVAGNQRGLFIYDAEYNVLRDNLIVGNDVGAHLWAGSIHNQVERNDFIHNRQQLRYIATRDEVWGAEQGNYWSNYVGWDRDGDGRGDVRYEANDVVDRLVWQILAVKLLLNSPALQSLRLIAQQFPLLRAPSIVDPQPRMQPRHPNWSEWNDSARH
ncbi:nitrous oxide reductase family maturation protein NosD [Steroidobacter flavus]|uniref:Nitrous oxide reductase family maturation protein NosD n=1 Tax=Steroidobacter flavus TaxID=1842136 RepID=A0ABV8SW80_9GAMM